MDTFFTDPYAELSREALDASGESVVYRLNSEVSRADLNFIRSLRPKVNTITIVTNILIKKLVDALKERGIDCYADRERFERFVGECSIVGPTVPDHVASDEPPVSGDFRKRSAAGGRSGHPLQTPPPHVGRGTEAASADAPSQSPLPADVRSNAPARSKRGEGKKKREEA